LTFDVAGPTSGSGSISGSGALAKLGSGNLLLSASNSYSGSTAVTGGRLTLLNSSALGNTSSTLISGATLGVQNNITIAKPITLTGTLDNASGTNFFTGSISLGLSNTVVTVGTNSALTLSNALTGTGGLMKNGPGTLTLAGASANSYSSPTY